MARQYGVPSGQWRLENELRERYGGCLTQAEVGRELGLRNHNSVSQWLADLTPLQINGRRKWRAGDVARKMFESEVIA